MSRSVHLKNGRAEVLEQESRLSSVALFGLGIKNDGQRRVEL